jgi:hypothetical protein
MPKMAKRWAERIAELAALESKFVTANNNGSHDEALHHLRIELDTLRARYAR